MNWNTIRAYTFLAIKVAGILATMWYVASATAALVHADPMTMDQQFVELAQRDGFGAQAGFAGLIGAAHQVCQMRMAGESETAVIHDVFMESQLTQLSTAAALVHDAEQVYCPGYLGYGGSVT